MRDQHYLCLIALELLYQPISKRMDILAAKPIPVYIASLMTKPVNLANLMIVKTASNAPICIAHVGGNEPSMMESKLQKTIHSDKKEDQHSINTFHFKLPERWDKKVEWHNSVKISNEILKTYWRKEVRIPDDYLTICDKFFFMLTPFEGLWDRHLGSTNAVQHWIELQDTDIQSISSVPFQSGPKKR